MTGLLTSPPWRYEGLPFDNPKFGVNKLLIILKVLKAILSTITLLTADSWLAVLVASFDILTEIFLLIVEILKK